MLKWLLGGADARHDRDGGGAPATLTGSGDAPASRDLVEYWRAAQLFWSAFSRKNLIERTTGLFERFHPVSQQ